MTTKTANSIESLMKLPFHVFYFQYKTLEESIRAKLKKAQQS